MLINGYDSTVGSPFRFTDGVANTIKTLHMTRNLTPTKKEGVFCLTNATDIGVDIFSFPITLESHTRQMITVFDERPYRNKNNQILHPNEIAIIRLAAFLQQDVVMKNMTPLKNGRLLSTKAFSESISTKLINSKGLDPNEALTLKVLLAYYYVCLQESPSDELDFIVLNIVSTLFGTRRDYVLGVIEELPRITTLPDLLEQIKANPILFKLKTLSLKELITIVGSISFAAMGPKIISVAAEAPCLFMALVYGAATFKALSRTQLGITLDPKYNKGTLEAFTKNIEFTYDLNG